MQKNTQGTFNRKNEASLGCGFPQLKWQTALSETATARKVKEKVQSDYAQFSSTLVIAPQALVPEDKTRILLVLMEDG